MKSFPIRTLSIIGTFAAFVYFTALATSAHAVSFNFSYEWDTGGKVEGMFVGDIQPDGNTVSVSEVMATYVGGENSRTGPTSPIPIVSQMSSSTGRATFDGSFVRFGALAPRDILLSVSNNFTEIIFFPGLFINLEVEGEPFDASRWHLELKPDVIPEPSTIILFGIGMLGLILLTHRKKASAAS